MPVEKVEGGYRWGKTGKVYKRRIDAVKQGQAAYASGYNQYGKGGDVKSVPEGNKGLAKLPKDVRNKMGYMKKGGMAFKLCKTCTTPTACTASQKCAKGANDYRYGGMVLTTKDNRKQK
jgi:hypothetical protein